MDPANNTSTEPREHRLAQGTIGRPTVALSLAWCPSEPGRVGEVLIIPDGGHDVVFGRGVPSTSDPAPRVTLSRERPGRLDDAGPLRSTFVSRTQLSLRHVRDGIQVHNLGKREIEIDGVKVDSGVVRVGQTLHVKGQLLFYCMRRTRLPTALMAPVAVHAFGEADARGIVGESAAAWQLRERIAFIGARSPHVLILGETGTGKELVAHALHASSPRRRHKLVVRSAASFAAGRSDAELVGNVANYPSPGMPEQAGVLGAADGSTLFLDEIADLPGDLHGHVLRFLDEREYQRLGDPSRRTADVRVLGATSRELAMLKPELVARLKLRIQVPSLNERLEDVPLLVRHLVQKIAARDPAIGERFLVGWDGARGEPRLSAALIAALLEHRYTSHVRELEALLWCAMSSSPGTEIDVTDELSEQLNTAGVPPGSARHDASAEEVRGALDKHGGVREKAWRELNLSNRYVLHKLMKRYGFPLVD